MDPRPGLAPGPTPRPRGRLLLLPESFETVRDWFRSGTIRRCKTVVKGRFPGRTPSDQGRRGALSCCRFDGASVETFGILAAMTDSADRAQGPTPPTNHDDSPDRRQDGRIGPDRVEGHQRPVGRRARDPPTGRGRDPRRGLRATTQIDPPVAAAGGDLPRARERMGAGDRARRRARRRPASPGRRPVRDAGPADDPAGAGSRASWSVARPGSSPSSPTSSDALRDQLRSRGIPFVVVDPTGEPLHDTPSDRGDQLEWRPDRDAPSARPGPPSDRGHRRARVDPVQPGPARRLSGGDGRGRRADRPASSISHGEFHVEEGDRKGPRAARACPTGRRPSSPATTSRHSASTRRRARPASTSRRTSASWASTTCRSRNGSGRR